MYYHWLQTLALPIRNLFAVASLLLCFCYGQIFDLDSDEDDRADRRALNTCLLNQASVVGKSLSLALTVRSIKFYFPIDKFDQAMIFLSPPS